MILTIVGLRKIIENVLIITPRILCIYTQQAYFKLEKITDTLKNKTSFGYNETSNLLLKQLTWWISWNKHYTYSNVQKTSNHVFPNYYCNRQTSYHIGLLAQLPGHLWLKIPKEIPSRRLSIKYWSL